MKLYILRKYKEYGDNQKKAQTQQWNDVLMAINEIRRAQNAKDSVLACWKTIQELIGFMMIVSSDKTLEEINEEFQYSVETMKFLKNYDIIDVIEMKWRG